MPTTPRRLWAPTGLDPQSCGQCSTARPYSHSRALMKVDSDVAVGRQAQLAVLVEQVGVEGEVPGPARQLEDPREQPGHQPVLGRRLQPERVAAFLHVERRADPPRRADIRDVAGLSTDRHRGSSCTPACRIPTSPHWLQFPSREGPSHCGRRSGALLAARRPNSATDPIHTAHSSTPSKRSSGSFGHAITGHASLQFPYQRFPHDDAERGSLGSCAR